MYSAHTGNRVIFDDRNCTVKGTQNKGEYARLVELPKPVKEDMLRHLYFGKGLRIT